MRPKRFLLLHGWSLNGSAMAPLARVLSPHGSVLCPDLPGHGGAGYPPDLAGARQMLAGLLAEPGPPVTLIGWSMGALLAWRLLAERPDLPVAALVTLDMSPRPLPAPGWDWPMGPEAAPLLSRAGRYRSHWQATAPAIARGIFAKGQTDLVPQVLPVIAARDGAVMATFWEELLAEDLRSAVAQIRVPQIFLHGAESQVCPPDCANWLAENAPSGKGIILPGVGHAPHLEAPEATAAALLSALKDACPDD